jgi:DHA1 family multidrug resistance protein-like MFS transporter
MSKADETPKEYTLRELMKGNILVLTVSRIIWSLSSSIVWPYQSLFIQDLGGSKPIIGLITALGNFTGMLFYPLGGYIADKSGRAKLVGYSTLLYASSFLIFAFAPTWEWIAVAISVQQLVLFYMPALNAIMADSIPPGARGKILSLTISIPEAVRILAPFIGGWLIETYTRVPAMRIGYILRFITAMFVAFMRIKLLKETLPPQEFEVNIRKIFTESYRNMWTSTKWIMNNLKGYTVISMTLIFIASLVQPFWVIYANEIVGLSEWQWGQMLLIAGLTKTVVSLFVGNYVDRIGPRKCMMIAFILGAPGMLAFPYVTGFISTTLVYVLLVLANAFVWISSGVYLANMIPRNIRGRIMAGLGQGIPLGISGGGYAQGFILFIPNMLGSMVSGYIYEVNPMYPWYINAVVLLLCLILTIKTVQEPETAEV